MNIYLQIIIGGFFGILLHTLVKVGGINKRLNTVNYGEVFSEYWKTDWVTVLLSITVVAAATFISSEWLNLKETDKTPTTVNEILQYKLNQFVKTASIAIGFLADAIVANYLSKTENKLIQQSKADGVSMEEIIKQKPIPPEKL
jgi:hypothetical protein